MSRPADEPFTPDPPPGLNAGLAASGGPDAPDDMAALVRDFDWANSALGRPETWPTSLKTIVRLLLTNDFPMTVLWGPDLIQIYNDGYRVILGRKHPRALGQATRDCWPEVWHINAPIYARVRAGETLSFENALYPIERHGFLEEAYFTLCYSPVTQDDGTVGGVLITVRETTLQVLAERRLHTLLTFGLAVDQAGTSRPLERALETLTKTAPDVPCLALYLPGAGGELALAVSVGLPDPQPGDTSWPLKEALQAQTDLILDLGPTPPVTGEELPVTQLALLPLIPPEPAAGQALGVLAVGLNPRRRIDGPYREFLRLLAGRVTQALERARAADQAERSVRQIEEEVRAQDTFIAFAEASGQINDLDSLTRTAFQTLRELFPGISAALYERRGDRWQARQYTEDLSPELAAELREGFPLTTPIFVEAETARQAIFSDQYSARAQGFEHADEFRAAALCPIEQGGVVHAQLGLGHHTPFVWSDQDRALVRAVGRSFSLLYDRIAAAEISRAGQLEAERRNEAMEAFSQLTSHLSVQQDPAALIRQAQEVAVRLLSLQQSVYWEPVDGRWEVRSWVGEALVGELQDFIGPGLSVGRVAPLDAAWSTRTGVYQHIDLSRVAGARPGRHIWSVAALPVMVGGAPCGVMNFSLLEPHDWTPVEQAVLTTVVKSLGLALERATSMAELALRSAELEQSNAALLGANEELEAFSYSVSHDLRTPVRHIKGFTELARGALAQEASAKAAQHLQIVEAAADRMSRMIDALLDLARTSRQEIQARPVDLNALVRRARQELEPDLQGRRVEWRLSALPEVVGDPDSLQLVLTNLLENAAKYSRTRTPARIEVWAEDFQGEWLIRVRDNGVGFDPRYQDRLFGVFQRLHTDREFEGNGVGLATVRRIVARHGGQVSAHSVLGEGATFQFTLPKLRGD